VFSPVEISPHITTGQWIIVAIGTAVVVVVNVVLMRTVFRPLRQLETMMRDVDPLAPGTRTALESPVNEVAGVARALDDMLERLEAERAESGRRALQAQESERGRVARELHDEVGQLLTGVVLQLEGIAGRVPGEVRGDIVQVQETAREGVEAVREIARGLRPPALDEFGLRPALAGLANGFTERSGIPIATVIEPGMRKLPDHVELAIYRVAQEALTNAARHASPTRVELSLKRSDGGLELRVADDGRGINGHAPPGVGIAGMRERALLVEGTLRIGARPGGGTEVVLELPG
jgi:two-component system sensor histidine kinase UhpB